MNSRNKVRCLTRKLYGLFFAFTFLPLVVAEQKNISHEIEPASDIPLWSLRVYNKTKEDFHACFKLEEKKTICANSSEKHVQVSDGEGGVFFELRDTPGYEFRRIGNISLVKFKNEKKERQLLVNNLAFDSREQVDDSYLGDIDESEFKKQAKELMVKGNVDAMAPLADAVDELELDKEQEKAARPVLTLAMNVLRTEDKLKENGELIMRESKYLDHRNRRRKRSSALAWIRCPWPWRKRAIGDECLGMCGPGCWMCWIHVCGDCCYHHGCYEHDICCKNDFWSSGCLSPLRLVLRFSCSGYPNCGKPPPCFPAAASVQRKDSKTIFLEDLQVGDEVLTISGEGNELVFTKVLAFLDHEPSASQTYLRLQLTNGDSLTVSKRHLIFKQEKGNVKTAVFAEEVAVGDYLFKYSEIGKSLQASRVVSVEEIQRRGAYAPLTEHGTILINGVFTSCYAEIRSHRIAHFALAPLRVWRSWFPSKKIQKGVHSYAMHLQNGMQWFKPLFPKSIAHIFESV